MIFPMCLGGHRNFYPMRRETRHYYVGGRIEGSTQFVTRFRRGLQNLSLELGGSYEICSSN